MSGAVVDTDSIPSEYFTDLMTIAQRPEFAKAQLAFIRKAQDWAGVANHLPDVETETLVLWGAQGWATVEERTRFMAQLPNANAQTLEGCGHFIAIECPDAVLAALIEP